MNNCADVTARIKDLAATFPMVTFLHIEADKLKRTDKSPVLPPSHYSILVVTQSKFNPYL